MKNGMNRTQRRQLEKNIRAELRADLKTLTEQRNEKQEKMEEILNAAKGEARALTEEEHQIYKRGRNSKTVTPAKNQSVTDYRRATGFEALIGYLYLRREYRRMLELIKLMDSALDEAEEAQSEGS